MVVAFPIMTNDQSMSRTFRTQAEFIAFRSYFSENLLADQVERFHHHCRQQSCVE